MTGDATAPDDYDRACAVDDLAGVIPIDENGAQALVLADEPATSCYLPQHRAFLRWLGPVDSGAYVRRWGGISGGAERVPPVAEASVGGGGGHRAGCERVSGRWRSPRPAASRTPS